MTEALSGPEAIKKNRPYLELKKQSKVKHCTKCGETKPKTEFYNNKRMPDGLAYYCKQCDKNRIYKKRPTTKEKEEEEKKRSTQNPELTPPPQHEPFNLTEPIKTTYTFKHGNIYHLKELLIQDMNQTNQKGQPLKTHLELLQHLEKKEA